MSCHDQRMLQMHRELDGDLSTEEQIELEQHLATCPSCRVTYAELRATVHALVRVEWVKAPVDFTESVLAQLGEMAPVKRNWRVPFIKYSGLAAAAVLVLGMGMWMATPEQFALEADDTRGLVVQDGKVIVPEGSEYNGDIVVQNGDLEVRGKVNGNVTALNGKIYRTASANISGEIDEVDEALEKLWYFGKQVWNDVTAWAH